MFKRLFPTLLLVLAGLGTAHAVPITMHFTLAGFEPLFGNTAAPTDPVTGTIVWDAASATSAIKSLLSIDLTLAGHVYSLGEIGFDPISNSKIGGTLGGVESLSVFTNDFGIAWNTTVLTPAFFDYSASDILGFWASTNFTQFSITEANPIGNAIPVPGTLALFAAAGFAFAARRRRS